MKNTIEEMWKEGFLNEKSLVAPKINDLYNQKSKHLVAKMERMFNVNLNILVVSAVLCPVVYYFLDALWEGISASVLFLLTAWYNKRQINNIKTLDQGATSLDYLKSLDRWIKDVLVKSEKIARLSYPLYWLIAISTVWSAWNQQGMNQIIHQKYPDSIFIGNTPLVVLAIGAVTVGLMFVFSIKIYKWEVRLMYGRVLNKLEQTIAEMEELKKGA